MKTTAIAMTAGCTLASLLACTAIAPSPEKLQDNVPMLEAAISALERECLADPLNAVAWRRLAAALTTSGEVERAARALRQAGMLEQNDLRADLSLVASGPPPGDGLARTRLVARADGTVELRRELGGVLLEVRNGNGVRGMAQQVASTLAQRDIQVIRLSNQRGFGVAHSMVEYHGDYAAAAKQLAGKIGAGRIIASKGALGAANVRVLLGHDQKKKKPPRRAAMAEKSLLGKIS